MVKKSTALLVISNFFCLNVYAGEQFACRIGNTSGSIQVYGKAYLSHRNGMEDRWVFHDNIQFDDQSFYLYATTIADQNVTDIQIDLSKPHKNVASGVGSISYPLNETETLRIDCQ